MDPATPRFRDGPLDDTFFLEWYNAQRLSPFNGQMITDLSRITVNHKDLISAALQESEGTQDNAKVRLCCHRLIRLDVDQKTRQASLDRLRDLLLLLRVLHDENTRTPERPRDVLIVFWEWYGDVRDGYRKDKLMKVEDIPLPIQKLIGRTLRDTDGAVVDQIEVYLILLLRQDIAWSVKYQCLPSICKLTGGERRDWMAALWPARRQLPRLRR